MLVEIESKEHHHTRPASFTIGETVQVISLGRTGRIIGTDSGRWLVRMTEGDAAISCDAYNLEKRQTLLG